MRAYDFYLAWCESASYFCRSSSEVSDDSVKDSLSRARKAIASIELETKEKCRQDRISVLRRELEECMKMEVK